MRVSWFVVAVAAALVFVADAVSAPAPMPLISRGVPAFASSNLYPARSANDASYDSVWRGSIPSWLAYDLSSVPVARRSKLLVAWYNDPITTPYDYVVAGDVAYNDIRDYTIQANAAPGGGSPPSSGWVTLTSVNGNRFHSRENVVSFAGYNWLRLNVTGGNGSSGNNDAAVNLDVHDASAGVDDSWMFYGDSITMDGLHHRELGSTGNFAQLIAAASKGRFPAFEDGGIGGLVAADGAAQIDNWLPAFPGQFVALNYGSNDANSCVGARSFTASYTTMVKAVLAAGKVPVVPTIPWARVANVQRCAPALNAAIRSLYSAYPSIVHGPDLWSLFQGNQGLISDDGLHPSTAGYAAYRKAWADAMLANVYSTPVVASPLRATRQVAILGTLRTGTVARVRAATWNRSPVRTTYAWQLCRGTHCSTLRGKTSARLLVARAYAGRSLRVVATASSGGQTARSTSVPRAVRRR